MSAEVHSPAPLGAAPMDDHDGYGRRVRLVPASSIPVRPVRWLWDLRIPLGSLTLLAGREGIGKSTAAAALAGQVTRGTLPGHYRGHPRAVLVAATEDSWSHTLVPRLMGAGADLDRVYRIDVDADGLAASLSLPRDVDQLAEAAREVDAALLLLDPLMSRLSHTLDTHRDAEVRQALEPLVRVADTTAMAVLGLIHVAKSSTTDPLTSVMGSRAFTAVARAVLYAAIDPDDDATRLLGLAKCNLGPLDQPTLAYRIEPTRVADTDEGPVTTARVVWLGERAQTIREVMEAAADTTEHRTAVQDAADWLTDHLTAQGGIDTSADIRTAGRRAGHSDSALARARRKLGVVAESSGYPRRTYWALPGTQPGQSSHVARGESDTTDMTDMTEPVVSVASVMSVVSCPPARACARNEGAS